MSFPSAVTVRDIAQQIGSGLARATLAGCVDGRLYDYDDVIHSDATVRMITARDSEGVEIIRHSCAHLIGHAVKQLFPAAQMAIGPVIEDGFYYDIFIDSPFSPDDLQRIEQRMADLIATQYDVRKKMTPREEALKIFQERNETYKQQLLNEMPDVQEVGLYYHQEYVDMCRGPHVPNTRFLRHFKLLSLAGAYWRGDANNEMLQRIYGTAWSDAKQLKSYLEHRAEAEKRDHRKIGKQLDWFHFQPESPGMVFWHDDGHTIYRAVENYMRHINQSHQYLEVHTPQLLNRRLWEESGHWDKFQEMIFITESEKREYAIKPMNCPGHIQIFNQELRSYRQLPYRVSEFGIVHRNEPSGTLHGLMRARCFTQDDAHIFCRADQLSEEFNRLITLTLNVYRDFGFEDIEISFSTRPIQRIGDDALWDRAENILQASLKTAGIDYKVNIGEGAFYGPKIEFTLKDSIGRKWQCGTLQLDFSMPERLGARYITAQKERAVPVMIHRAVLGSLERFIGILIEHYNGHLPLWLVPQQVMVMGITDRHREYAQKVENELRQQGLRVYADLRNEKISFKIREGTVNKVPWMVIVGDREQQSGTISVRTIDGKDLGGVSITQFANTLLQAIALRKDADDNFDRGTLA